MSVIRRREAILREAENDLRRLLGDDHGMGEEFLADVAEQVVGGLADQLAGAVDTLAKIERVYQRTMPGPRDDLRDRVLELIAAYRASARGR